MNNIQLERTLRLLRRTGDKAVVVDPGSDEVFMLMNLDAYEDMLDDLENIDPCGPFQNFDDDDGNAPSGDDLELSGGLSEDFDEAPIAEEELAVGADPIMVAPRPSQATQLEPLDFSEVWPKKEPAELGNEEGLADVPDEGEEEKFYLEPVE